MSEISTHNDGKCKESSWDARTIIKVIDAYDFEHEIEVRTYGSSERKSVDELISCVEKTLVKLNNKLETLMSERQNNTYDETDVTRRDFYY